MACVTVKKIGTIACAAALALLIPAGGWLYGQKRTDEKAAALVAQRARAERLWSAKDQADLTAYEQSVTEKELTERQMAVLSVMKETVPGIVCWGGSVTAGVSGGETYPAWLFNLLQTDMTTRFKHLFPADFVTDRQYRLSIPVTNMGVAGESSLTVAGRNGAIPYVTTEDLTIPADTQTMVRICFASQEGETVEPLIRGSNGIGSVTIGGVEGTLTARPAYGEEGRYAYYFNRTEEGEALTIPKGTVIETEASGLYKDYLAVIQLGQNGGYDDADDLVGQIRSIIEAQNDPERYIVLGLSFGDAEQIGQINAALSAAFGDHFIDLLQYMREEGLKDAGLEPGIEDIEALEAGYLPVSLTDGAGSYNATGYRLVAECIQRKMHELGYFDAIDAALGVVR